MSPATSDQHQPDGDGETGTARPPRIPTGSQPASARETPAVPAGPAEPSVPTDAGIPADPSVGGIQAGPGAPADAAAANNTPADPPAANNTPATGNTPAANNATAEAGPSAFPGPAEAAAGGPYATGPVGYGMPQPGQYPYGPYGYGYAYPAPPRPPRRPGRALAVGVATALAIIVLGAPLGLLWHALAPRLALVKVEGGLARADAVSEQPIAADGWFSLLGLGFGVLAAIAVWLIVRRYRGPIGLVAVVVGTLGAAVVAWQLGRRIGLDSFNQLAASAPPNTPLNRPPDIAAGRFEWVAGFIPTLQGDLLLPAFGAIVTYTLLAGWSRWPGLRPEPEPEPAISWGSAAPPAPSAAPAPPEPGAAEPPRD